MPEEPDKPVPRRRTITVSTVAVAWIISGLGVGYLLWTSAAGPLPYPELHDVVTTTLGVGTVLAWLWHVATDGSNRRRKDMAQVEARVHDDTAALSRQLYRIEAQVNQTGDEATDRIVGVVEAAQATIAARVTILEAAVSQHICRGYADGYADAVAGRAPDGVRTKLTAINGRRP